MAQAQMPMAIRPPSTIIFVKKCLPQVEEITSEYGPIELIWFDTPGQMPKKYIEQLIEVVRKNQPNALVSGRAGHGLGDYKTLGDMDVPSTNVEGMWESVDTTNDSWAFAWYDEYWKTPKEILRRLISCVARGGTYMLNIGPRGDGSIPERAACTLRAAGEWIKHYPQGRLWYRCITLATCPALGRCDGKRQYALSLYFQLACLWHTLSARPQNRNRICIPPRWRSIYTF